MSEAPDGKVIPLASKSKRISSTERIWGKKVIKLGYTGVPSILFKAQRRLGINSTQLNIIVQLLEYWYDPARPPFPSKKQLADRIGIHPKTIQTNIRHLEQAGYIRREKQKSGAGDWTSNKYHLDGLVQKIRELEPEFTKARADKAAITKRAETPKGKRSA